MFIFIFLKKLFNYIYNLNFNQLQSIKQIQSKHIIKQSIKLENENLQTENQNLQDETKLKQNDQNISNEQENLINVPIREKPIKKESSLLKSKSLQNNNSNKFVL